MIELNRIYNEDCIGDRGMCLIPDKSVDMILCDLPYGTASKNKNIKWDIVIDFELLWEQYKRIIKDDGNIVLTGSQPFTSMLIMSNLEWFRYELIWEKSKTTQFLTAKLMPMKKHENILVFTKNPIAPSVKNRSTYNPQGLIKIDKPKVQKHKKASSCISGRGNYEGKEFIKEYTNYPHSLLRFANEGKTLHPTQKPLDMFEWLINTYSNEGEIVLDNCMGSGTTAIACINTNRNYIGFEWYPDEPHNTYFELANKRIEEHKCKINI